MRDKSLDLIFLGPGSDLPQWIEALEREAFRDPWGVLGPQERIWALPGLAYAQWSVIPGLEGELLRIAVAPSEQGKGHGARLLAHCQKQLAQEGLQTLHLEVRLSNTKARKLYERLGWKITGQRRAYYKNGEDAVLYALDF